jgi:hypothetical protein
MRIEEVYEYAKESSVKRKVLRSKISLHDLV